MEILCKSEVLPPWCEVPAVHVCADNCRLLTSRNGRFLLPWWRESYGKRFTISKNPYSLLFTFLAKLHHQPTSRPDKCIMLSSRLFCCFWRRSNCYGNYLVSLFDLLSCDGSDRNFSTGLISSIFQLKTFNIAQVHTFCATFHHHCDFLLCLVIKNTLFEFLCILGYILRSVWFWSYIHINGDSNHFQSL